MPVFSIELARVVHHEGSPLAVGTGAVTLIAAVLAVAVGIAATAREWRRAWLVAASLCLLLAVDEALPLAHWIVRYTGVRWWLVYLVPVGVGAWGWLRAMSLLERRLRWHSPPVQLLSRGTLCWIAAFSARGFAFLNEHGPGIRLAGFPLLVEAIFKLAGAVIWCVALTLIFIRIRAPQEARTPLAVPFVGHQPSTRTVALAQGGSDRDDEA